LLTAPDADPPLYLGGPGDPILGPLPTAEAPVAEPAAAAPAPGEPLTAPAPVSVEPEVVWAAGRSTEQVLALVRAARRQHPDRPAVVLRAPAETLVALAGEHDAYTTMDAAAMAAAVG